MDKLPTYGNRSGLEVGASNSPPVSTAELQRLQHIQQQHLRQKQQQAAAAAQSRQNPALRASHLESQQQQQQQLRHPQPHLHGRQAQSRGQPLLSRQQQSARQSIPSTANRVSCGQPPHVQQQQAVSMRGQNLPLAPAIACKRRQAHLGKSPSQSPPQRGPLQPRLRTVAITSGVPQPKDTAARSLPYCRVPVAAAAATAAAAIVAPAASAMASPKVSASRTSHGLVSH